MHITSNDPLVIESEQWPRDVELIVSALHAAGYRSADRRLLHRRRHRAIARLTLFFTHSDPPIRLYVRDCTARNLGFLTEKPVPLGFGGSVELLGPDQRPLTAACIINRCRECVPGWFEGTLAFNRPQAILQFPA